ncbi:MAG: hypothetical protein A2016_09040 [Elusimicrobia bacterium GWF2_62_30]|nr:MAG: hypothetical protein A2016_09040 [Elusimicrobia bacterium GWF2_62_30]
MLKKILLVFTLFTLFSAQAYAQQDPKKALVVVRSSVDDRFGFLMAVQHIMQLKVAGVEVHALFEGEAVLFFLGKATLESYRNIPTGAVVVSSNPVLSQVKPVPLLLGDTTTYILPQENPRPAGEAPGAPIVEKEFKFPGRLVKTAAGFTFGSPFTSTREEYFWLTMTDFTAAKIPYTLCSRSATMLGMHAKLKALGLPLSPDPVGFVDLAPFVKGNYQVIVY